MKSLSFFWSTRSYHPVCVCVCVCVRVWRVGGGGGGGYKEVMRGGEQYTKEMQTIRSARKYTAVH